MSTPAATVPPARAELPPGAWTAVGLLWMAGASNYLTRTMLTTMRGSVLEDIPMSDAQFGLLTTAFLWVYAVASPFGGFFADRFSRRSVVIVSVAGWSLLTLATLAAHSFGSFLGLRAALGLAQAFYIPAAGALIIDYHRGPTRAFAGGLHATGLVLGSLVGGIGGWLAEQHGWRYAYAAVAIPNLGLGVLLFFLLREPPREQVTAPAATPAGAGADTFSFGEAIRSLLKPGPFYAMVGTMAIQGGVSWIIIGWMPTIIREQFNLGQAAAGFSALGFLYSFQIGGLLLGGFFSDRLSARNARARIFLPAIAILCATPVFWILAATPRLDLSLVSLACYGAAMGTMGANIVPIVCLTVDPRFRATAVGLLNGVTAVCGGLAVFGVGALRDAGFGAQVVLAVAAAGVLACGVLLWLVNVGVRRAGAPAA